MTEPAAPKPCTFAPTYGHNTSVPQRDYVKLYRRRTAWNDLRNSPDWDTRLAAFGEFLRTMGAGGLHNLDENGFLVEDHKSDYVLRA